MMGSAPSPWARAMGRTGLTPEKPYVVRQARYLGSDARKNKRLAGEGPSGLPDPLCQQRVDDRARCVECRFYIQVGGIEQVRVGGWL